MSDGETRGKEVNSSYNLRKRRKSPFDQHRRRRRIRWPRENDFATLAFQKSVSRYPSLEYLRAKNSAHEWNLTERWRKRIESRTRKQSKSPYWFLYRRHLITASSSGKIYRHIKNDRLRQAGASIEKFFSGNLFCIPAIAWGVLKEGVARDEVRTLLGKNFRVTEHGMIISKRFSYIACSPDGIIRNLSTGETILLEIKCPYSARNTKISEANLPYLDSNLNLRSTSDYFSQIQVSMECIGVNSCLFYIYSPRGSSYCYVKKNQKYIDDCYQVYEDYYVNFYIPSVL